MDIHVSRFTGVRLSFVLCAVLWIALVGNAEAEDGWRWGRATFYGIHWSLHYGSCGYGQLDYHRNTGWNVAAISDWHYEYHGSCGACYEIKCEPMSFSDNYGNYLDRTDACYDPNRTVIVAIVDSCPCNYASNYYSNKRWCCQDMDHLDISYVTYDQLADRKWGVIGLKYRPVACPDPSYLERRNHYGDGGRKLKSVVVHEPQDGVKMIISDAGFTEYSASLADAVRRGKA